MAGKTNTESIRELEKNVAIFETRLEEIRADLTKLKEKYDQLTETVRGLETRLTLQEERFTDWKKVLEERDLKRRQLFLLFLGSVLTLLANVLLFFLGKK